MIGTDKVSCHIRSDPAEGPATNADPLHEGGRPMKMQSVPYRRCHMAKARTSRATAHRRCDNPAGRAADLSLQLDASYLASRAAEPARQGVVDDLLRLVHKRLQVGLIPEALGVNLVDVLSTRWPGGKPSVRGDDL